MREGLIASSDVARLKADFLAHVEKQYALVIADRVVLDGAAALIDRHQLRALDSIQLACTVQASKNLPVSITFISADSNLLNAAAAEGFQTDNPLNHP